MPKGDEVFLGLNKSGAIAFILLLILCLPLCWLPFILDGCKAEKKG